MRKIILSITASLAFLGGFSQVVLFDPIVTPTMGSAAQDFEAIYDIYDTYIADDFTVPAGSDWWIDSIRLYGTYSAGAVTEAGVIITIYENNNGSFGNMVFTDTIQTDVDENGDGWLTPKWLANPIQLAPGDYWMVGTARKDFAGGGGQWFWVRESTLFGELAMWSNPGNGFNSNCTSFVPFYQCDSLGVSDSGMAFRIYGCYGPMKPAGVNLSGGDTTFCEGTGSATFVASSTSNNIGYIWNNGFTTSSITTDTAGTYSVLIYDTITQCGYFEGPVTVNTLTVPYYDILDDTVCPEVLPYNLFANPVNCTVTWFDNTNGFSTQVTQAGTYWATFNGFNGCVGTDTMTLTVQTQSPPTFIPGSNIDLCVGDDVNVTTSAVYNTYAWGNANDTNTVISANPTFNVSTGGTYWLDAIAANGCSTTGQFTVIDRPLPTPTINTAFNSSFNVKLSTQTYASYEWSNGDTTKNTTVTSNGTYTLTVTDEFGCVGTTSVDVDNVGVDDPIASAFGFHPNPTNGVIHFTWPNWNGEISLEVIDASGRQVMMLQNATNKNQIDLSNVQSGVYFIKLNTPKGTGQARVIKQ